MTADYVMGVRLVTAEGNVLSTGRKAIKDVAGYNLAKFIVGSQGTLGLITEALLEVVPLPGARTLLVVYFPGTRLAANTVSNIIAKNIIPSILEFLDNTTLRAVEEYLDVGFPEDVGTMLLIELDGHPEVVQDDANTIRNICEEQGAIGIKTYGAPESASQPYQWRKSAFSALSSLRPFTLLMEIDCAPERFADLEESIKNISEIFNVMIGIFGNIGNGNFFLMIGAENQNPEVLDRVNKALDEVYRAIVDMGGTILYLHSPGEMKLSKIQGVQPVFSEREIEIMRQIKHTFDPEGVFHSGRLIL